MKTEPEVREEMHKIRGLMSDLLKKRGVNKAVDLNSSDRLDYICWDAQQAAYYWVLYNGT